MEVRPGYKRTGVGVIPDDWDVTPLADVAQIRSGIAKNEKVAVADPIRVHYLRVANVQDGYLDLSDMSTLEVSRCDLPRFAVLPGDVLMNEGGDRDKLGRGAIWRGEFDPCVHQNHVFVVRPGPHLVSDYLNVWSGGPSARRYFLVAGRQTTNLASINKTALGELPVVVPTIREQQTIAEALGDVDALLAGLDRLISKKRDLKQAATQQLLTGQTRLPGFFGNWEQRTVGELALDGPRNGYSPAGAMDARGTPTLRLTATTSGRLILNEETIKRLDENIEPDSDLFLRPGDLLVQRSNTADLVGTAALFDGPSDTYVYPDLMMRLRFREETTARWIWRYMNSHHGRRFFLAGAAGSTGSMPKISGEMLRAMIVPFPPGAEQAAIVDVLADMDAELAALEARWEKTRDLKQAMMQELLTGRTRLV